MTWVRTRGDEFGGRLERNVLLVVHGVQQSDGTHIELIPEAQGCKAWSRKLRDRAEIESVYAQSDAVH
jgi:hypothetical protein